MVATTTPSKLFSTPRAIIIPVTNQASHRISMEIHQYTPITYPNHQRNYCPSAFNQSTLQISHIILSHRCTRQSRTSLTTSTITVCQEIAPHLLQTQPPHASWDLSI